MVHYFSAAYFFAFLRTVMKTVSTTAKITPVMITATSTHTYTKLPPSSAGGTLAIKLVCCIGDRERGNHLSFQPSLATYQCLALYLYRANFIYPVSDTMLLNYTTCIVKTDKSCPVKKCMCHINNNHRPPRFNLAAKF